MGNCGSRPTYVEQPPPRADLPPEPARKSTAHPQAAPSYGALHGAGAVALGVPALGRGAMAGPIPGVIPAAMPAAKPTAKPTAQPTAMPTAAASGRRHSFSAYVLCDFTAESAHELSVSRGEFVEVVVDELNGAPDGWCYCIPLRASPLRNVDAYGGAYGLLPWMYLVSAAHVEIERMLSPEPMPYALPGEEGLAADSARDGPPRPVRVRRTERGAAQGHLGLDVDTRNTIVRISPVSAAAEDGELRAGDVVITLDNKPLEDQWLVDVIRALPRQESEFADTPLFPPYVAPRFPHMS